MEATFGGLVADRRKTRGYTQAELAQKVGVSRNYMSMIERNETPALSISILIRLADATETDMVVLAQSFARQYYWGTEQPPAPQEG